MLPVLCLNAYGKLVPRRRSLCGAGAIPRVGSRRIVYYGNYVSRSRVPLSGAPSFKEATAMPFPESLKLEVRLKAHFRCCKCEQGPIEVHHIVLESQGGPDTIDNAAPLCPSCHSYFGDNPVLKKTIREMRDAWYERCRKRDEAGIVKLEEINEALLKQDGRIEKKLDEKVESLRAEIEGLRADLGNLKEAPGIVGNAKLKARVQGLETRATAISGEILSSTTSYFHVPKWECPKCGSHDLESHNEFTLGTDDARSWYVCKACGNKWPWGE